MMHSQWPSNILFPDSRHRTPVFGGGLDWPGRAYPSPIGRPPDVL